VIAFLSDTVDGRNLAPVVEASTFVAPTQPEAGAGQRRRAFKMPDEAGVAAPLDLDASQRADPVVAAAAWA